MKFICVGFLNTAVGYGIYSLLIFLAFPYVFAILVATIAGVIFNYFSFGRMVFSLKGGWFVFVKFVVAYALVYFLNTALLVFLVNKTILDYYQAQTVCIIPNIAMSWLLMNFWVYKDVKHND